MSSKSKGSGFEREISRFLTKWLTGQEKPYIFYRMPASGALATIAEQNQQLSGDIIAVDKQGIFFTRFFNIECKMGYSGADFWKFLNGAKNNEIEDFWVQCTSDAQKSEKQPLLIFKKTRKHPIIGINMNLYNILKGKLESLPCIQISYHDLCILDMKDFFDIIKPDEIKNLLEILEK